jgi:hypothetical protein
MYHYCIVLVVSLVVGWDGGWLLLCVNGTVVTVVTVCVVVAVRVLICLFVVCLDLCLVDGNGKRQERKRN